MCFHNTPYFMKIIDISLLKSLFCLSTQIRKKAYNSNSFEMANTLYSFRRPIFVQFTYEIFICSIYSINFSQYIILAYRSFIYTYTLVRCCSCYLCTPHCCGESRGLHQFPVSIFCLVVVILIHMCKDIY